MKKNQFIKFAYYYIVVVNVVILLAIIDIPFFVELFYSNHQDNFFHIIVNILYALCLIFLFIATRRLLIHIIHIAIFFIIIFSEILNDRISNLLLIKEVYEITFLNIGIIFSNFIANLSFTKSKEKKENSE